MNKFPVLEVFGPTVQGEGMVVGQKTMFVRTAGCDYSCSWCDSAFTWDGSAKDEIKMMTAEEIFHQLKMIGEDRFSHVTISGGNPALLKNLHELVGLLHENGIEVALETQGSKWQDWFLHIDDLTISPKPPSSLMKTDFHILSEIISRLQENRSNFSLKVVIFNEEDFVYAKDVHKRYPDVPFYLQAGNDLLAEDDDGKLLQHLVKRYEWLIEQTMGSSDLNNVRVLPQLHTYVWGNKKGV
ncbi:7-carboxy-7-deazaguanine synthase QueE [Falsibacillus albus]|uniref:7-carboxy-7-deazaguanine synthase n=1 Tax=Falsibacillus albus TaxID=2478915 RepID=A0A3L7JYP8_9BACI|nr:7-carboxy-7-deazaguanine synthase QueE [Falsibacillus albus]RLQ95384.1 7-carboxy-7-deazaguanine synthase QueE [Falsibacillus albus]